MNLLRKSAFILAALAAGCVVQAAEATRPEKPDKSDLSAAAKSADIQKLTEQFNQRRDAMLADREAILNQLKNATAEQQKQLLEKLQTQQKDWIETQRALGKQLRDEMRKLRQSSGGAGRR